MKITIQSIAERGVPGKERLVLKVLCDVNLTFFIVLDTFLVSPRTVSSRPRRAFWFDPKPVKAGDLVVLYTKEGVPSETKRDDGTTVHFLYWNLKNVLWDKTGNCAVLMEIDSWETSAYE